MNCGSCAGYCPESRSWGAFFPYCVPCRSMGRAVLPLSKAWATGGQSGHPGTYGMKRNSPEFRLVKRVVALSLRPGSLSAAGTLDRWGAGITDAPVPASRTAAKAIVRRNHKIIRQTGSLQRFKVW